MNAVLFRLLIEHTDISVLAVKSGIRADIRRGLFIKMRQPFVIFEDLLCHKEE